MKELSAHFAALERSATRKDYLTARSIRVKDGACTGEQDNPGCPRTRAGRPRSQLTTRLRGPSIGE